MLGDGVLFVRDDCIKKSSWIMETLRTSVICVMKLRVSDYNEVDLRLRRHVEWCLREIKET